MTWTPNRIVLIGNGRKDEAPSNANVYPGMLLQPDSSGNVGPHAVPGGSGELMIVEEDALQGGDITQEIVNPSIVPFRRGMKGDKYLMLLQEGWAVTAGGPLMSAGDGTLIPNPGTVLWQTLADSSVITNTASETAFSNGVYGIAANLLQPGDVLKIRAKATCGGQNSTNTERVRIRIGGLTGTVLAHTTAIAMVATDFAILEVYVTIRSITSSGKIIADARVSYSVSGTVTTTQTELGSTTLDSTVSESIQVTALQSAASAGNQITLNEFEVDLVRPTGLNTMVQADETKDNTGDTGTSGFNNAMFVRVLVP